MIHSTAEVQTINIGTNTDVWQYSVILEGAIIGDNCNINSHVFIENDVKLGNNVTVKSGVQIWDGIEIRDDVFIGPNATFTNDRRPRSKQYPENFLRTIIEKKATIGAAAVILGGKKIGSFAMIGAGAVVTKNVPDRALIVGNPGKIIGWLNDDGSKMRKEGDYYLDQNGSKWRVEEEKIIKL